VIKVLIKHCDVTMIVPAAAAALAVANSPKISQIKSVQ